MCLPAASIGVMSAEGALDDPDELLRRSRIDRQRLFAVVTVNGKRVHRTKDEYLLWPSFSVSFNQPVRLRFARRPQTLEVELWKRRRWRSFRRDG